ncbi:hypothetical protein EVAR_45501_1 [Eumeta japonica]|uniref:Uncharacterized protein n=1 Tax=Eumeta variegata TaxID=151549 RepID=A0A4C1WHC4_EUMVA|nr:hypothetical protein EVAR_45501_1 [Eumeta japonica]
MDRATEGEECRLKDEEINDFCNIETKMKNKESKSYDSEVNVSILTDLSKNNNTRKKKKKNIEVIDIDVPAKKTKSDCDSTKSTLLDTNMKIILNEEKCPLNNEQEKVMKNDKSQTKRLKYLNAEESQIKDEDIDKFCEDLDDESNSQYENWIKLIDAKLHSKTTK